MISLWYSHLIYYVHYTSYVLLAFSIQLKNLRALNLESTSPSSRRSLLVKLQSARLHARACSSLVSFVKQNCSAKKTTCAAFLDIKFAFDSAWNPAILLGLVKKKTVPWISYAYFKVSYFPDWWWFHLAVSA